VVARTGTRVLGQPQSLPESVDGAAQSVDSSSSFLRGQETLPPLSGTMCETSSSQSELYVGPTEFRQDAAQVLWWRDLLHAGIRANLQQAGVILKLPLDSDYDTALAHAIRFVNRLNVCFYVGISEHPHHRWQDHRCNGFARMYVLAVGKDSSFTSRLEKDLLFHLRGRSNLCMNNSSGGERSSAGSPHFFYVVVRDSALTRKPPGSAKRTCLRMDDLDQMRRDLYNPSLF
jgi:hypothetical protein